MQNLQTQITEYIAGVYKLSTTQPEVFCSPLACVWWSAGLALEY